MIKISLTHHVKKRRLGRALDEATSYAQWLEAARQLDEMDGLDQWRADADSPFYEASRIHRAQEHLRQFREQRDFSGLVNLLHESLHRHLGDIMHPELYETARAGTKHLIDAFLEEAEQAISEACRWDVPGVTRAMKQEIVGRAAHNFGRSALVLSGGASWGLFHMGVVKALWEEGLLPRVICGSSMGAYVAAALCVRTDHELKRLFEGDADLQLRHFKTLSIPGIWKTGAVMDSGRLLESIRHNVGTVTFHEAYQRTGRILNITVSPTRARQKPRLLNHMTAPDVLIAESVLASCSVPGLFPPCQLMKRASDGSAIPYIPDERWIDGTLYGDLPLMRLGRLLNVNHTIVSQVNPHVLPFLEPMAKPALLRSSMGFLVSSSRHVTANALKLAGQTLPEGYSRQAVDTLKSVTEQVYTGDINIFPPVRPKMWTRILSNPKAEDLDTYTAMGQQAAWPKLAMIRNHTAISRLLERNLAWLQQI